MRRLALLLTVAVALAGCGTAALVGTVADTAMGVAGTALDIVTYPVR